MATFLLSEAEYLEACRLSARPTTKKLVWSAAPFVLVVAVVAPLMGLGLGGTIAGVVGGLLGGGLAAYAMRRYHFPRKVSAIFHQHKALREPLTFTWDETGTHFSSTLGQANTPWSHYREVREGQTVFILLLTESMYHMVPKSALGNQSDVDAFRAATHRVRV